MVELAGGGSVINGANHIYFFQGLKKNISFKKKLQNFAINIKNREFLTERNFKIYVTWKMKDSKYKKMVFGHEKVQTARKII